MYHKHDIRGSERFINKMNSLTTNTFHKTLIQSSCNNTNDFAPYYFNSLGEDKINVAVLNTLV